MRKEKILLAFQDLLTGYREASHELAKTFDRAPFIDNEVTLKATEAIAALEKKDHRTMRKEEIKKELEKFLNENLEKSKDKTGWKNETFRQGWISALVHVKVNFLELLPTLPDEPEEKKCKHKDAKPHYSNEGNYILCPDCGYLEEIEL